MTSANVAFARRRDFWRLLARAALLGLLGALATVAFLALEHGLHGLLWHDTDAASGWFTGPVRVVPVLLGASLLVGLLRRWTGRVPPDPNFVDELEHGRTDPAPGAALVGIGLVSLVGGASLGPEAPIATAGAAIGTAVGERSARRRGVQDAEAEVADSAFAGMAGVFGGLITFPFAVPLIALELHDADRFDGYHRLLPGLVSATVALAVLVPLIGTPFVGLFEVAPAELRSWHLAAAVLLGLVGAGLGTLTAVVTGVVGGLLQHLRSPVTRALAGGTALAAIGVALPLTLFSGRDELGLVLAGPGEFAIGLLVATVLAKMVALGVSLRAGFFGGAILPLVFIGGVGGVLVAEAWPALPLLHAVTAVSAATATALIGLPLSLMVLTVLLFATGVEAAAVPAVAVVTSYVAIHGTALLTIIARLLTPGASGSAATEDRETGHQQA